MFLLLASFLLHDLAYEVGIIQQQLHAEKDSLQLRPAAGSE
jgi:hypothetical protein